MDAYAAGDVRAFERLFRSLAPSLHAFFARSVGHGPAAEDLVQTTFLKLHAARGTWRAGERVRPWVFTIAGRVRVDWLRKQGRTEEEAPDETTADPDGWGNPGDTALANERASRVKAAVDSLPEPQRVIVHLHRLEGLSFMEIGKALGISEGAAKLRAFRAYGQLRKLLGDLVAEDR